MKLTVQARAAATVANQPTFDAGGFPVRVREVIMGETQPWETLTDSVLLSLDIEDVSSVISIENDIKEQGVVSLSTESYENTAGRTILSCIDVLKNHNADFRYAMRISLRKGISTMGTGLGSSGAAPAAALRAFEMLLEQLNIHNPFDDSVKAKIMKDADFGVPDNAIPAYFGGLNLIDMSNNDSIRVTKIQKSRYFGEFVVVTPKGFGIKTADARKALEGLSPPDNNVHFVDRMVESISQGQTQMYGKLMEQAHSWFVKPRSRLYPKNGEVFDKVYDAAKESGAFGVTISGAGPSMLAVVDSEDTGRKVGMAMHEAFKQCGYDSVARLVDIDDRGAR